MRWSFLWHYFQIHQWSLLVSREEIMKNGHRTYLHFFLKRWMPSKWKLRHLIDLLLSFLMMYKCLTSSEGSQNKFTLKFLGKFVVNSFTIALILEFTWVTQPMLCLVSMESAFSKESKYVSFIIIEVSVQKFRDATNFKLHYFSFDLKST